MSTRDSLRQEAAAGYKKLATESDLPTEPPADEVALENVLKTVPDSTENPSMGLRDTSSDGVWAKQSLV